jgi:hypothetical protein
LALRNAVKETILIRQADHHIPRRFFQREPLDFDFHTESLTETYFKRLYRTSKEEFKSFLSLIESDPRRFRTRPLGNASSADLRVTLAVTQRYLAGARGLDIGWPHGLGDSTVYLLTRPWNVFLVDLRMLYFRRQETMRIVRLPRCRDYVTRHFSE